MLYFGTIDTNTEYPQMITKILFGISNTNIIIHGSKWCENVRAGGLQATGGAGAGPTNDNISQVSIEAAEAGEGNVIKFYSRIIFIQLQSSRGRHVVIITPRSKLQTALYLCSAACVRTLYKPGPGPGSWSAPVWCWITEQLLESVNWANTSITLSLSSMWPAAGSILAIVRTRSQHGHDIT